MVNPYSTLLQPGRIGSMELKNRITMAPMGSSYCGEDGKVTDRLLAYFEARAKGGAGLISTGVTSIAWPAGRSEPHQLGVSNDDFIPGLSELARRTHQHGAKIAMQLHHGGKTAAEDAATGREMWLPSIPPHYDTNILDGLTHEELATFVSNFSGEPPKLRVMDAADIEQMIEWFAAAALRAQSAGFDGVEVHGAHTYILANFLSPYYNTRDDRWGGSLENRARLLLDVIRAVKQRTGGDFPVWVRLDGEELRTPGGITPTDAVATARLCAEAGADAIHMSAYASITTGTAFTEAPLPQQIDAYVGYAKAVKKAVQVPVIVAGRIEAEAASKAIAAGDYDFVAMGRKLLADPNLPKKLTESRPQDIRPCVYCYACVSQIFVKKSVLCAVNALTGHEFDTAVEVASTPRHVLVIGGGPGGMEAARVAAARGHKITLVERSNRLGGTLFFAALAYPENGKLLDYLVEQMKHPNISVRLETNAAPDLVAELKPHHIVVATGARRDAPPIPGADQKFVWSGDELRRLMTGDGAEAIARAKLSLAERAMFKAGGMIGVTDSRGVLNSLSKLWMPLGKRVVIVGGGLVGLELAEFLLARGRQVTLLEESDKLGRELSIVRRWRVIEAVREHGDVHTDAKVLAIGKKSAQWQDKAGATHDTPADSVVLAVGAVADDSVARRFADCGVPVDAIGDCAEVGYIMGAMHAGNRVGRSV